MAIILEANYAKKLGLPGFSSHQYSVSIRAELTDLSQIQQESSRLYGLLQGAVDQSIQQVGFLPEPATHGNTTRTSNGHNHARTERSASTNGHQTRAEWRCSDKQSALIQKVVHEKALDKGEVERLAIEMFGAGVRQLDRLQASGLIDELFERHGGGAPRGDGRSRHNGNGSQHSDMATVAAQARSVSRPPKEDTKAGAFALVETYLRDTPIPLQERPEGVEVLVENDLAGHGLPKLVGIIGLVRQGGRIVDFKTTGRTPDPDMVLHTTEVQTTSYSMLYREATDREERGIELPHLVRLKTPKLVVTQTGPATDHQHDKLLRLIDSYVVGLSRGLRALAWVPVRRLRVLQRVPGLALREGWAAPGMQPGPLSV